MNVEIWIQNTWINSSSKLNAYSLTCKLYTACLTLSSHDRKKMLGRSLNQFSVVNADTASGQDNITISLCVCLGVWVCVCVHICRSGWGSMTMLGTFTAVHRSESLPSVDGPTHLCRNPEESHHTRVRSVPAGQDHLWSRDASLLEWSSFKTTCLSFSLCCCLSGVQRGCLLLAKDVFFLCWEIVCFTFKTMVMKIRKGDSSGVHRLFEGQGWKKKRRIQCTV